MHTSSEVAEMINTVFSMAQSAHFEYVTPELALYVICQNKVFARAFENCGGSVKELDSQLRTYLDTYMERIPAEAESTPELSMGMGNMLAYAWESAEGSGKPVVELPHVIHAMYELEESYAVYYMRMQGVEMTELLQEMAMAYEEIEYESESSEGKESTDTQESFWQQYAVCLNDEVETFNPLIGREEELERTMQILCRKEKNNPLHIGEPGVGKTAVTYGLARLLNEGKVPDSLIGARIFSLDLGSLLAGTQYRGDFEKRFKRVMESINREEKPIIYIDEIHNIVGAGAVNGGTFDISNMLKPYLAAGHVRFIGATTHEEYKKHFEKSKSLVRRFQNVEIKEPGIQDAVQILEGLKKNYEEFHGVSYEEGVLAYAVEMSAKYINERHLPDKAIDLIDEAGAYRRMHLLEQKIQTVDKELIDEILSKTCHIPRQVVEKDETESLATLERRLQSCVFGQDEAIAQVVNAVKFSRAGLLEDGKPLASLLFVGPTGVGKTEIARSLAREMGIKLIRFDMSEYEEKHAVAKLIGAPAGYVGYEEGGLLTEEIRKNPHAVLLLDEIEKAHSDIYNILLQVMDYATLTDNQGRKADFRNVIVIMTSNAGASRIGKHRIGFGEQDINCLL
ncbi:MAG: AAA family ATPase [Lachnospiraceae bacterium]|nr:AAA family ATPase [Lachnospiraceae bacterium]